MPLFFILSGYTFSTKRSWSEFLFNKCKVLLVPYTVFAICNLAFYDLLSKNHAGDYAFGENALKFLLQQRHTYLWFLPTLFLSSVVTYLICRTKNCNPLVGGGILLITYHLIKGFGGSSWIWNLDIVPLCSFFMLVGNWYKNKGCEWHFESKPLYVVCISVIAILAICCNYRFFEHVDILGDSFGCYPLFYLGAILGTYSLILILKLCKQYSSALLFFGANSLIYYGFHKILIEVCFVIIGKCHIPFSTTSLYGVAVAVINVILVSVLLVPVCLFINRRAPWLIGRKVNRQTL